MIQQDWLTIFTGVVAVALLLQSLAFLGIHRSIKALSIRMDSLSKDLQKTVGSLAGKVEETLCSIKLAADSTHALQDNVGSTVAIVHKRVSDVDALLGEVSSAARLQIIRIQDLLDIASRRIEETLDILKYTVLKPASEVSAIARGIQAGLEVLSRRPKSPSKRSHQDEELFI